MNLLYEIMNEAIILPLFYFIGKVKDDKDEFSNRVRTGMLISLGVYAVLSAVVLVFAEPMLKLRYYSIFSSDSQYGLENITSLFKIQKLSHYSKKKPFEKVIFIFEKGLDFLSLLWYVVVLTGG